MTDLASIVNENLPRLAAGEEVVYFEVSSRLMNGASLTSKRRSHLMWVLPSKPGAAGEVDGPAPDAASHRSARRRASRRPSTCPAGRFGFITAASAPSARIQAAPSLHPHLRENRGQRTPVHSEVLVRPWVPCTVFSVGSFHSVSPVAGALDEVEARHRGEAASSRHRVLHRRSTIPCTMREWRAGVDGGDAAVMALEVEADGVMMPCPDSSGSWSRTIPWWRWGSATGPRSRTATGCRSRRRRW